jgi:hypothetical protein
MRRIAGASLGLVMVVLLAGCQRLNYEKDHTVKATGPTVLEFDAPRYEQKLTVTIRPSNAACSAYIGKQDDQSAIENALNAGKEPAASMLFGSRSSKGKTPEEYSFDATVPAKVPYVLLLRTEGFKDNLVNVKVVGR